MPRRPEGERALTDVERQARRRLRKAAQDRQMRAAMERVTVARTISEARDIALAALAAPGTDQGQHDQQQATGTQAQQQQHQRRREEAVFEDRVQAEVRKRIDEDLMPYYGERLQRAEALLRGGKPFTHEEYRLLVLATHPDNSASKETRNRASQILQEKRLLLRPEAKERPLSGGLPESLADLLARKKTKTR